MLTLSAYRIGRNAEISPSLSTDSRTIYHNLNPHPALAPIPDPDAPTTIEEQAKNEADYRQLLVQGALTVLLPTEDLENACLRILVADVIAEPILGNAIGGKLCESWFIWGSITRLVEVVQAKVKPKATGTEIEADTRSRLEKFGLLSGKEEKTGRGLKKRRSTFSSVFWRILQLIYLGYLTLRFVIIGLFAAHLQAPRSSTIPKASKSASSSPTKDHFDPAFQLRPIVKFRIFSLIASIADLPHRTPWLHGMLALVQHHLIRGLLSVVGGTDGIFDQ